jgi:hypothetical protein
MAARTVALFFGIAGLGLSYSLKLDRIPRRQKVCLYWTNLAPVNPALELL